MRGGGWEKKKRKNNKKWVQLGSEVREERSEMREERRNKGG